MTKTLTALIPGPLTITVTDVETPHYEGVPADALLPPRGEDVWVDHPAFSQCPLLRQTLTAVGCDLAMGRRLGRNATQLDEIDDWLNGRTPIPEKRLSALLRVRKKIAKIKGIPKPLPPIREK